MDRRMPEEPEPSPHSTNGFFTELTNRRVIQTCLIYLAVAWGATEAAITVTERLGLPDWIATLVTVGFVVGFPVAVFLSWVFDLTSEGVQRTGIRSVRGALAVTVAISVFLGGGTWLFLSVEEVELKQLAAGELVEPIAIVAVMDPVAIDGDDALEVYAAGFGAEVRARLSRYPDIAVVADESVNSPVLAGLTPAQHAKELYADYVLTGDMRRTSNLLAVDLSLVDAVGSLVWEFATRVSAERQLDAHRQVADEIATRLDAAFAPSDYCEPSSNIEALEYYWRGKRLLTSYVFVPETEKAIEFLRRAVALDPEFGLAYSELSAGYTILPSKMRNRPEYRERVPIVRGMARDMARTATRLCPTAALAYKIAPVPVTGIANAWINLEIQYRNALQMESQNPMLNSFYIQHLEDIGQFRRALQVAERTYRADPLAPRALVDLGRVAAWTGDGERALAMAKRANELGPASPNAFFLHLQAAAAIGDPIRSPAIVNAAIDDYRDRLHPSFATDIERARIMGSWIGRDTDPDVRREKLEAAATVARDVPGFAAMLAAGAGQIDTALSYLEAAEGTGRIRASMTELWLDMPGMDALRADPRFAALVERGGLPAFWREYGWPDGKCRPLGDSVTCD